MSTLVSPPNPAPVWKQEVNRRLAAHKTRKGACPAEPEPQAIRLSGNSRAALAAARVAARYAKAPSYSQLQAAEARAAHRSTESAAEKLRPSAAPQPVVAVPKPRMVAREPVAAMPEMAAADSESAAGVLFEPENLVAVPPLSVAPAATILSAAEPLEPQARLVETGMGSRIEIPSGAFADDRPLAIRWEPDMPVRPAEPATARLARAVEEPSRLFEPETRVSRDSLAAEELEPVEPDQPIHANLIEFPREVVAARKARPHLAEGSHVPAVDPAASQLSIFEVDPDSISTEPDAEATTAQPRPFEWSGIKLDAQPEEEIELEPEPVSEAPALHLAPFNRRVLAAFVDATLIGGAFVAAAWAAVSRMDRLPALKPLEAGAVLAFLAIGGLYQMLFSAFAEATPGMKYAGISLCTFDDQVPTRAQRCGRFGALALSMLPVGLGIAWAVFDEEHLSWHDRLSKTYQRKC